MPKCRAFPLLFARAGDKDASAPASGCVALKGYFEREKLRHCGTYIGQPLCLFKDQKGHSDYVMG